MRALRFLGSERAELAMIRILCSRGLAVFPALFATLSMLCFIITYIIAVYYNHVYPYWPTISQSGIQQPERNVFTLLLGSASFLGVITVAIRCLHLHYEAQTLQLISRAFYWANLLALLVGLAACFGALMVASFQGKGWSVTGHMTGAAFTFGGGVLYCWVHVYTSYHLVRYGLRSKPLLVVRVILATLASLTLVCCISTMRVAYDLWAKGNGQRTDYERWCPSDPGYAEHVISAASEWITATFLLAYFVTFCGEFQGIGLEVKVKRKDPMHYSYYSSGEIDSPLI